jgi:hypothetical protein
LCAAQNNDWKDMTDKNELKIGESLEAMSSSCSNENIDIEKYKP